MFGQDNGKTGDQVLQAKEGEMGKQENLRIVSVPKAEPDLRKLARVLLVLVGELPAADPATPVVALPEAEEGAA